MQQFLDKIGRDFNAFISMFDTIEDLVFLMRSDEDSFRYEYVNRSGLKVLNSDKGIIGNRIEEMVSPDLAQHLIAKYKQAIITKKPLSFEESIEAYGSEVAGETSLNPIVTNDGQCEYVLAIVRDITERKKDEQEISKIKEQLERERKRLHSLVKYNDHIVFELDLDGNFKNINESATRITGYKEQELIGTPFLPLVPEADQEELYTRFDQALQGKNQENEAWIYHQDGHMVLLHVRIIPIIIDGVLDGLYGMARDITKEREMENELNEVKSQLELAWDYSNDAIFLLSPNGTILTANPTFEKMLGYNQKEKNGVVNSPILPPYEISRQESYLEKLRKGETVTNIEVPRLTKDGRTLNILASYKPINHEHILAVGMYKDITERKRILRKLEESEERYRKMVEMSPDAVIIHKNRKFIYVNKAGLELLGIHTEQDVIGESIWPFVHPDERDWIEQIILKIENGIELVSDFKEPLQQRVVQLNGKVIHTEVTSTSGKHKDGRAIQAVFRDISERIKHEKQLAFMAFHDPLTGLNNRRAFLERMEERIKPDKNKNKRFAVMYLDMDDFKKVNDEWGHETGDELLVQFAKRLRVNVRENDILCRVGGDEFLVLLENITDKQCVIEIAERLNRATQEPYIINGNEIHVTTSVGISVYPNDGITSKVLIHHADEALYLSKDERNKYHFFSQCI